MRPHHKEFLYLPELCRRWRQASGDIERLIVQRDLPRAYLIQGKARMELDPVDRPGPAEESGIFDAHVLVHARGNFPPDPTRISFEQLLVVYPAGDADINLRSYSSLAQGYSGWPSGDSYLSFLATPPPAIDGTKEPWFYVGDVYDFEERYGIDAPAINPNSAEPYSLAVRRLLPHLNLPPGHKPLLLIGEMPAREKKRRGVIYSGDLSELLAKHGISAVLPTVSTQQGDSGNQPRKPQRHKAQCREVAAAIWRREPDLTIAAMVRRDEIRKQACEGRVYHEEVITRWIKDLCPNRTPGRRRKRPTNPTP